MNPHLKYLIAKIQLPYMSDESSGEESSSSSSADGPPIFTGQRISKGKRRKRNASAGG